jgi:hypothetical protein
MNKDPFTIIIDTREQLPWEFGYHSTSHQKLDTGDYSIAGFEDVLAIERKRSVSEIANNLSESRFLDVLDRMSKIRYSFILLEFELNDVLEYPNNSDIPKKLWSKLRVSGNYILKRLVEIQMQYGIHIMLCGSIENARRTAVSIMKRVYEQQTNNI